MVIPPSGKETIMNKQKHLNLEARILIETMLNEHHSFKSIARELGKDCTTISKEIKAHICFEKTGALGRSFNDCRVAFLHQCSLQKFCQHCAYSNNKPCWTCGRCTSSCISYEKYICPKLSKPPYVCNGCQQRTRCSLEKRLYKASYAQKEYEQVRSESRSGFALSEAELKQLDDVVSPLLKKGQSLHHIAVHHADELMKSERTLYTYTNNGLFTARNIDMPRTIRMRPRKNVSSKLKVDKSCRIGRDFHCFEIYMAEHPDASVRQLDSVEGIKGGAVLLAGGQGTRLGLDRPKGTLNIGIHRELFLFQQLIRNLMDVTDEAGAYVPLYIMTSNINHDDTQAFFEEHSYFGYPKEYVKFFVQEMEPACDHQGRVYMESRTRVAMSPNGNGGWFGSMVNAGLLSDIRSHGIEWINVFAVDNCLQRIADPLFIGATIAYGCESGAKVVRKAAPDEKVGVLCTEDGKPSIAEYYEMTQEMATARKANGDLLYGFGVILNYVFSEKRLEEIADAHMPIHVVEKKIPYMDESGSLVKPDAPNGYKFETLVLDMVHMMADCVPYEVDRKREFAPIKNLHGVDSLDSARELMQGCGIEL